MSGSALWVPGVLVMRGRHGGCLAYEGREVGWTESYDPFDWYRSPLAGGNEVTFVERIMAEEAGCTNELVFPETRIDGERFPLARRAAESARLLVLPHGSQLSRSVARYTFCGMHDTREYGGDAKHYSGYNFTLQCHPEGKELGGYLFEFVEAYEELIAGWEDEAVRELFHRNAAQLVLRHVMESASGGVLTLDGMILAVLLDALARDRSPGELLPGVPSALSPPRSREGRLTMWEHRLRQLFERAAPHEDEAKRIADAIRGRGREDRSVVLPIYGQGTVVRIPELADTTAGYFTKLHGPTTFPAASYVVVEGARDEHGFEPGWDEALAAWRAGKELDPAPPQTTSLPASLRLVLMVIAVLFVYLFIRSCLNDPPRLHHAPPPVPSLEQEIDAPDDRDAFLKESDRALDEVEEFLRKYGGEQRH
jgi:hypothetical protein